jgi:hypothetical protein
VAAGDLPDGLERGHHIELERRSRQVVGRRVVLALLAAIPVLGLVNLFGQRTSETTAAGAAATLTVRAPARLRGGLLYQTAFTIVAHKPIKRLHLVLSPGWLDGLTLNTVEPAAGNEGSRNGRVSLSYGTLDPGQKIVVFADWQVNPTTVTRRHVNADVYDGGKLLARAHRTLTVFP